MKIKSIFIILVFLASAAAAVSADEMMDRAKTNVTFQSGDGTAIKGYLTTPSGSGPFPGVVMVPEWWGLNKNITALADALRKEGYAVLAVDPFRGSLAKTPEKAMTQVQSNSREQIAADMDAALDYLRNHSKVDGDRVASLGFCFGGTQSMYMGTRNPELAAVVIFYGSGPITDAGQLGSMRQAGPVLGIYGADDGNIPVSQVRSFESALDSKNVENTITVYPGVGHAFVKSNNYNGGGTAEEAWNQMVDFLDDAIK